MNIIESVSKSLSLRAECLKLEIHIIWEGDTILKKYNDIDKCIGVNKQKLDYCNDIQFQMKTINDKINSNLNDNIICTNSKIKINMWNQIQKYNDVKQITEKKYKHICVLNNELIDIEELLVNRLGFYVIVLLDYKDIYNFVST